MRLALAISTLIAAGTALSVVAAAIVASPGRGGAVGHAQTAPCPGSTPVVASQPAPTPQPIADAVRSRVTVPETGSAGLLPGSRRPLALQAPPTCSAATQSPSAASTTTATPSTTATAPATTTTPSANAPGGGSIGGGGGVDIGGGGLGGY